MRPVVTASAGFAFAMLLAGCGGAEQEELITVSGRVTLDGKPLTNGTVSLRGPEYQTWHHPTGRIDSQGRYVIYSNERQGAPPGTYRAVVVSNEQSTADGAHPGLPRSLIPARYNDPARSPFEIQVSREASETSYDLELQSHE